MKKLVLISMLVLITGCATYVPYGSLFVEGKQGLQDNGGPATKSGEACMHSYLSFIAVGDASIEAAKLSAGISKVSTIDYRVENVLGLYGSYCTVVTGE